MIKLLDFFEELIQKLRARWRYPARRYYYCRTCGGPTAMKALSSIRNLTDEEQMGINKKALMDGRYYHDLEYAIYLQQKKKVKR